MKTGAENYLSGPSSFIAHAHNEMYAFYTEKEAFREKYEPIGGGSVAPTATFNRPLEGTGKEGGSRDCVVLKIRENML